MKLHSHLAASAVAGGAVWAGTGEPVTLPLTIAAGVLPDADHLLDYYFRFIRRNKRYQFLLLHGWEYLIAGIAAYLFVWSEPWMLAIVVGYATQIGLDQIAHGKKSERRFVYWLTVRAKRRFSSPDRFLPWRPLPRLAGRTGRAGKAI